MRLRFAHMAVPNCMALERRLELFRRDPFQPTDFFTLVVGAFV